MLLLGNMDIVSCKTARPARQRQARAHNIPRTDDMARKILDRMVESLNGSNGADELGKAAVAASFALLLVGILANVRWLSTVALAFALYAWWRMASRNVAQRQRENQAFLKALGPAAAFVRSPRAVFEEHRAYKHLTCPSCHQHVRVPRGKGKLRVTCPSCHTKFDARS